MKKILLMLMLALLLFPLVAGESNFEFDNVKNYDYETQTVDIRNSVLGLDFWQLDSVATAELLWKQTTWLEYSDNRLVAEIKVNLFDKDYKNFFNDVEFYDVGNLLESKEKGYTIKKKVLVGQYSEDTYETITNKLPNGTEVIVGRVVNGSVLKNTYEYQDFDGTITEGETVVGVFTDVGLGDHIEWIPEIFGVKVPEWAEFVGATRLANLSSGQQDEQTDAQGNRTQCQEFAVPAGQSRAIVGVSYMLCKASDWADSDYFGNFSVYNVNASRQAGVLRAMNDTAELSTIEAITPTCDGSAGYWYNVTFPTFTMNESTTYFACMATPAESGGATDNIKWVRDGNKGYAEGWAIGTGFLDAAGQLKIFGGEWGDDKMFEVWATAPDAADDEPLVTLTLPEDQTNWTVNAILTNGSATDEWGVQNITLILDGVDNSTVTGGAETNLSIQVNLTGLSEGYHNISFRASDNSSQRNWTTNSTVFIDTLNPAVSLSLPENITYTASGTTYTAALNYSVSDTNIGICWYYNGTANTTVACGTNATVVLTEGQHTFMIYANDTLGNINSSSSTFFVNLYTSYHNYTNPAIEGENYTFSFNLTSTALVGFNGTLYYNGTARDTVVTSNATGGQLISHVVLPQVTTASNINVYWSYAINGSWYNTTTYQQIVQDIPLPSFNLSCTDGLSAAMNFSFQNEENSSTYASNVNYILRYGITNSSQVSTNGSLTNVTTFSLCINSSLYNNYSIGYGEIQYETTGFADRRWYVFENERLSNNTISNVLYVLTGSNSFLFTIQDSSLTKYVGKYLTLNRWYPEADQYKVVEMAKTDDKGQTVMKVKVEDVDYRVGTYHTNGSLIYLANPLRFVCIASPCTYTLTIPTTAADAYDNWDNVQYNLTYNDTTNIFTFIYNDPSQDTSEVRLEVFRETGSRSISICSDSGSSYTDVLTCDVSGYSGTLRATAYRTASPEIPIVTRMIREATDALDNDMGLLITLVTVIIFALIGIVSPVLTIILSIIAFIPAVIFGIVPLQIMMILSAIGFIVIHFMRRSAG